jgi:hypothetical protein
LTITAGALAIPSSEARLEDEDLAGGSACAGLLRHGQHVVHEAHVALAVLLELRIVLQVVIAIGQSEPALEDIQNVVIGLAGIAVHESDQRIDQIQLEHPAEVAREIALAL